MFSAKNPNGVPRLESESAVIFEWPSPPYFNFEFEEGMPDSRACFIFLRNGTKVVGNVTGLLKEESSILYSQIHGEKQDVIYLEEVKSIRLMERITLKKKQTPLESRADELFPASESQPFTVVYLDKEILNGQTIGYSNTVNGLYLFTPDAHEKIERLFIPHQAMAYYQIGSKVGEILINEEMVSKKEVDAALFRQKELRIQRIGDYLSEHKIISIEQLEEAIKFQKSQPILRLGEALQQLHLITQEQLDEALANQKQNRHLPLGKILVEMNVIDERTLKGVLAKKMGIPFVVLSSFNFDSNAINLVEKSLARKHMLIPLCIQDETLIVALEDPLNITALEQLRFITQKKIVPAMASHEEIQSAINKYYGKNNARQNFDTLNEHIEESEFTFKQNPDTLNTEALTEKLFGESLELELPKDTITESDSTLVKLINKMIMAAYEDGISDIHIETYSGKQNTRVRFRKDGTLIPYLEVPASARNAMISRIKIMAQLDISERRKPQDGKINFQNFGPAKLELRVATIPTNNNLEDIVMRLLASSKPLPMEKLGLAPEILTNLQNLMQRPNGLILVCGPTGSGKTTTLHSVLGYINTPERKIWTAEDPVEITQSGLRQVQVNAKIGWTFAAAMRSFLRADPDVIMVGEMRDEETTRIAIEASLTGHLVLSTLHTNSAPESVVRLLDLGMDPFNFADALQAVLAQRLAKALCPKCKQSYNAEITEIENLATEYVIDTKINPSEVLEQWQKQYMLENKFRLYKAVGCDFCNQTGYRGRVGLHELMVVTPAIKRLIQTKSLVSDILEGALVAGMHTLKQDGISKVLQGHTDITQVRSVAI
jgi:type II secretory ATPase GspE/PulE/Tfp pilus assembly ATPase PilB-like protein